MADTATATTELVNASESDWGKMTAEERIADVDAAIEEIRSQAPAGQTASEAALYGSVVGAGKPGQAAAGEVTTETEDETTDAGDETPAGDDSAASGADAAGGEDQGDDSETTDWLDQETHDLATAMGLTDEDLSDFGSREELDRALRIIDRKAFEAGKKPLIPAAQPEKPAAAPQAAKKPVTIFDDLSQFKVDENVFDPDAVKPINTFVEAAAATIKDLQTRLARFEQQSASAQVENLRSKALESLHSLGHVELFGKPGERPTEAQLANIHKAIDAHFVHAKGLLAAGKKPEPTPAFLKAAVYLAFGDEITKQQQQRLTDKLRKQSARRTGGSSAKPLPRAKGSVSTLEDVMTDPDIDAKFNALVSERKG